MIKMYATDATNHSFSRLYRSLTGNLWATMAVVLEKAGPPIDDLVSFPFLCFCFCFFVSVANEFRFGSLLGVDS